MGPFAKLPVKVRLLLICVLVPVVGIWYARQSRPSTYTAIPAAQASLQKAAEEKGVRVRFVGTPEVAKMEDADAPGSPPVYHVIGRVMVESKQNPGYERDLPYQCQMIWEGFPGRYHVMLTTVDSQVVQDNRAQAMRAAYPQGVRY